MLVDTPPRISPIVEKRGGGVFVRNRTDDTSVGVVLLLNLGAYTLLAVVSK